jgi:hypothetical protein
MDARTALANALGDTLGKDLTPGQLALTDLVLIRLWLHGYQVQPVPEEAEGE